MNLTQANMDTLFTTINVRLNKGLAKAWQDYTRFADVIPSSTAIEKYPLTVITGAMREWIGERVINSISGEFMTVRNRPFERSEEISRADLADDQYSFYLRLFETMGVNAGNLWPKLATEALCNPGNWADGKPFFNSNASGSSARKFGKSVIQNKLANSAALTVANYEAAYELMQGFCGADGDPLGLVPNILMVGAPNLNAANRIAKMELAILSEGAAAESNPHKGEVEVLYNPYLNGAFKDMWFLMCTTQGLMPVAVQKRKEGSLVRVDSETDSRVVVTGKNLYAIDSRGAAVAAMPHLVIAGGMA